MNLTNETGLPETLVAAIRNDAWDGGAFDITVSQLGQPPRKRYLERLHRDEITEDASERLWALYGQIVHLILERSKDTGVVKEKRLSDTFLGWTVGGKPDHLVVKDGLLSDWKFVTAWNLYYGDQKVAWEAQTNAYAELLERHGYTVNQVQVVALLRDWSEADAKRIKLYPKTPVVTVPLRLWERAERVSWIESRVRIHQEAESGVSLPECTPEERWHRNGKFARCDGRYCKAQPWCPQARGFEWE